MSNNRFKNLGILILVLLCASSTSFGQQSEPLEIKFIPRDGSPEKTIKFEEEMGQELKDAIDDYEKYERRHGRAALGPPSEGPSFERKLNKYLKLIADALEKKGAKCCEKRKRLNDCVWSCCDGNRISTCNKTLKLALTYLFSMEEAYGHKK